MQILAKLRSFKYTKADQLFNNVYKNKIINKNLIINVKGQTPNKKAVTFNNNIKKKKTKKNKDKVNFHPKLMYQNK